MSTSNVLGVVVMARHGDRQEFWQDPDTYTTSQTTITPLGNKQEFQLGQLLRQLYLNSTSPSFISGVNGTLFNQTQVYARADGSSGEGGVIVDSAVSLLQGLFPANPNYTTTLANGSTIEGPLNGYQIVPLETVELDNDISLEGWTDCGTFNTATEVFYNSSEFAQKQSETAAFLSDLSKYLDGRPSTLVNMWNIYDFMNVQSIHTPGFLAALPPTYLAQARDLANWHEYNIFTSPELTGIGNIGGQAVLPSIINGLTSIADSTDPLKFTLIQVSYKPFLSFFNMTGAAQANSSLAAIVNYAAAMTLEVRESSSGEPVVRFNFKNGTDDDNFITYNFLNATGDVPLSTFIDYLAPSAINTTSEWCTVCNNTQDRGCGAIAQAASQASAAARVHQRISPVGAGFLGAGLTLAVVLAMFAVLTFLGVLTLGRGRSKASRRTSSPDAQTDEKHV